MKIDITRQTVYILILSIVLFIFVLLFSFLLLIPEGKEYRIKRAENKKIKTEVNKFDNFNTNTLSILKQLQSDNRYIITAFGTSFSKERFIKQYAKYFTTLELSRRVKSENEGEFITYDLNTSSQMSSPKSFYDFLEVINKSDWIIGINFPIDFRRDGEMIRSTFSMKIYSNPKESNETKELDLRE